MTENKERFVLYEYLSFFWKKKWLFVILPIVTLLLGALLSLLLSANYTGKAIFYTGNVKGSITDPDYVQNIYSGFVKKSALEIKVDNQDQVTFIVKGDDKGVVKKELRDISKNYNGKLKQEAKEDIDVTIEGIELKEKRLVLLEEKIIPAYLNLLEQGKLNEVEQTRLLDYEYSLKEVVESVKRMNEDINSYEPPKRIHYEVNQDPKHLRANMLLGFAAGIFLTIVTLIVWKYILNARRFYNHD